jgi:hypothetical protein
MQQGPNMKRLHDMDVSDTVRVCVVAGPGDLLMWEVSASMDSDGTGLDVIGRGSDLEAAAACALAVLSQNGSVVELAADEGSMPMDGDAAF